MKKADAFNLSGTATVDEFNTIYPSILISLRYLAGDLGLGTVCMDLDYVIARAPMSMEISRRIRDRAAPAPVGPDG